MKERIWLSSPHMGGNEQKYIAEAFESNYIAPLGRNVNLFEKDLQSYLEHGHVAALSSGTAAIHLALIMIGVKPGDFIIASSFTFSASVNPITYVGANPILIDSEPETWNMDPDLLEQALVDCSSKGIFPKAIILVHLYGMPAKLNKILEIAEKYNIPIIEDAAEALGSEYKGRKLGTFGQFGVLSFNGNKIITTSGGGALICSSEEQANHARFLASQARDKAPHYQHSQIGYNYRMSNVLAGIGRGQMEVIAHRVIQRRANFQFYYDFFADIEGIDVLKESNESYYSNYWLTTIRVNSQKLGGLTPELIYQSLEEELIESRPLWKPMHLQPVFADAMRYVNGTSERLFEEGLCLPSGSNLSESDKLRIVEVLKRTIPAK